MERTIAAGDMSGEHATDFRAEQRLLELGPVRVWPVGMARPGAGGEKGVAAIAGTRSPVSGSSSGSTRTTLG